MSDEFDDEVSLDDTFDDFKEGGDKKTLGDAWRENSLFKIGSVVGAGVLVFGVISMMGGADEAPTARSYVGEASKVSVAPGTEEASPAYIQALEEQNESDREVAEATGGSALPVPIEPPVGVISVPQEEDDTEDPLQRWRRLQEERLQREIQQRETIGTVSVNDQAQQNEAIQQLAETMQEQMTSILETQSSVAVSTINPTAPGFLEYLRQKNSGELDGDAETSSASGSGSDSDSFADEFEEDIIQEILVPAGELAYAQLLTEANSDAPSSVLAQIMSGPLAGNRIIGEFTVENDLLLLTFNTVVIDRESVSIDAIGLNPDTALPGMATEVNHHYLKRIVLPAAAAFVEGLSSAIAENGSTTITINSTSTTASEDEDLDSDQEIATGVEEAGEELRTIVDEITDDIETLVRIEAGTPIGILFVEPVQTGDAEI